MKAQFLGLLVTVGSLTTASWTGAQTIYNWDPPAHANVFSTATNWTPAGPPGSTDEARFNQGNSTYAVAFSTDPTNARVSIGDDHVTFNLNGHTYALTSLSTSSPSIMVGGITLADDALLTIRDGTLVGQHAVIAPVALQIAAGMVVDTGGTLNLAGTFTISEQLPGSLTIQNGGDVLSATGVLGESGAGDGSVTVTGAGSTWINSGSVYVGGQAAADGGNGTLSITNQGLVDIDGTLKLWPGGTVALNGGTLETASIELAGGSFNWTAGTLRYSAELIVDPTGPFGGSLAVGAGNALEVADANLIVGQTGNGTLTISDGAEVIVDNVQEYGTQGSLRLGEELNSNGAVIVDNASLRVGPFIDVGIAGTGRLEIRNGGDVANFRAVLGFLGEQTIAHTVIRSGQVIVEGNGSTLLSQGNFTLSAAGSLNITNGAAVRVMRVAVLEIIPGDGDLNGTVEISDASLRFDDQLTIRGSVDVAMQGALWSSEESNEESEVAPGGIVRIDGAGSLWNSPAGILVDGTLIVSNGGSAQAPTVDVLVNGEIHGDGNIVGNLQNGGTVSPGALTIDGDYTQTSSGTLLIELASASSYDQLLTTGTATLGGTLTVNLLDSFVPSPGQSFTILMADDVDDMFTTEMLPSVPSRTFDVVYNAQSVVLTVLSALPGDYNDNGTVDAADYTLWQDHLGQTFSLTNENPAAATPGVVDEEDYAFWKSHFGESIGSGAGATAGLSSGAEAAVPEPATISLAIFVSLLTSLVRRSLPRPSDF